MYRIEREKRVVAKMIASYCRICHGKNGGMLCNECRDLMDYALARLEHCPKGDDKRSCRKCEIHCYAPDYRAKIRAVMRFMGPRMLLISPMAALRHLWDER